MRAMKIFCFLVLAIGFSLPAAAAQLDDSGNDFLQECAAINKEDDSPSTIDMVKNHACVTYVLGVEQGVMVENSRFTGKPVPFKVPNTVSRLQTARLVQKYVSDNPQ